MQVQRVQQDINFKGKNIPNSLHRNIMALKQRMELDTVIIRGKDFNQTINVRGITINNGEVIFKDGKFLAKRNKQKKLIPYGEDTAMIEFENVRILSNGKGEIIEYKKPIWKRWDKVFKQAENYVQYALENYRDDNIVEKQCRKKETLTKNGVEQVQKIMKLFDELNPFGKR